MTEGNQPITPRKICEGKENALKHPTAELQASQNSRRAVIVFFYLVNFVTFVAGGPRADKTLCKVMGVCLNQLRMFQLITHTHTHTNTHTHTHTHTHTCTHAHTHTHTHVCFCEKWGLSIGVMVFILYILYVLLPYTYPIPKLSPHRRLCISTFPKKLTLYDL